MWAPAVTCGTAPSTQTCCPDGTGVTFIDTTTLCSPAATQWISCDGRFGRIKQTDGNLVLHEGLRGHALRQPALGGLRGLRVDAGDGNFVVYGSAGMAAGDACWASGTNGHAGAHLQLQDDGNLVMYPSPGDAGAIPDAGASIWFAQTCCH